jgi:hypothetical protein
LYTVVLFFERKNAKMEELPPSGAWSTALHVQS